MFVLSFAIFSSVILVFMVGLNTVFCVFLFLCVLFMELGLFIFGDVGFGYLVGCTNDVVLGRGCRWNWV